MISPPASRHGFRTPSPHEVLARIIASGLRVVPGTDAGIGSFKPHDVYPHALSQLADLGMPTRDVLRSATSEAVGRGRLRPVADADLLVLGRLTCADPCRPSQLRGRARMLGLTRRRGRAPEPRSP